MSEDMYTYTFAMKLDGEFMCYTVKIFEGTIMYAKAGTERWIVDAMRECHPKVWARALETLVWGMYKRESKERELMVRNRELVGNIQNFIKAFKEFMESDL